MSATDKAIKNRTDERILAERAVQPEILAQAKEKQQKGIEVARQCARMLKKQFGVTRVVLYGNFLAPERLYWLSNLELAVWGLDELDLLKAGVAADKIADAKGLDVAEVELLEMADVAPHALKEIDTEGIVL